MYGRIHPRIPCLGQFRKCPLSDPFYSHALYNKGMKNTHIEHPEDSILTGDLSVLDWFVTSGKLSVKIDGAPAIVWGTNPANGQFFVGTKSVFNKFKIKINHHHSDVDRNHQGQVADILHKCLDYLPFTTGIYQGDFIGSGGTNSFNPNTIRYDFPDKVSQEIVIAPHTYYIADKDLRDAVAYPLQFNLESDDDVLFVQPEVSISDERDSIIERCQFARQIATLCEFASDKQLPRIKKQLNTCIREDVEIDDLTLEALAIDNNIDVNVLRLWQLVRSIKWDMFPLIERDADIECYINDEECDHEGYVMSNKFGTFKIVNRKIFSYANFAISRSRV